MKLINTLKKNTILLLIITVVVLYFVLKDNFTEIVDNLSHIKISYVLVATIFYFISIIIKGYVNYLIINEPEKVDKKEAIRQNFIAQFFNGITPFSTGGEPMGVYMLTERGVSLPKATNDMVQSFAFYQIALVLMGMIAVSYNSIFHLFPKVKLLEHLVVLGFIINTVVVILLLLSYSKKITKKFCNITIKVLRKLKIEFNEENIVHKFEDYHNCFNTLKKRKRIIVWGILLNTISLICLYLVPYWIFRGIGDTTINIMATIVSSAYVYLIGAFVPIPGASGGIEYGFTQFYGNFTEVNIVSAVLIVWRFITYYLGIIIGALLFNIRRRSDKK